MVQTRELLQEPSDLGLNCLILYYMGSLYCAVKLRGITLGIVYKGGMSLLANIWYCRSILTNYMAKLITNISFLKVYCTIFPLYHFHYSCNLYLYPVLYFTILSTVNTQNTSCFGTSRLVIYSNFWTGTLCPSDILPLWAEKNQLITGHFRNSHKYMIVFELDQNLNTSPSLSANTRPGHCGGKLSSFSH